MLLEYRETRTPCRGARARQPAACVSLRCAGPGCAAALTPACPATLRAKRTDQCRELPSTPFDHASASPARVTNTSRPAAHGQRPAAATIAQRERLTSLGTRPAMCDPRSPVTAAAAAAADPQFVVRSTHDRTNSCADCRRRTGRSVGRGVSGAAGRALGDHRAAAGKLAAAAGRVLPHAHARDVPLARDRAAGARAFRARLCPGGRHHRHGQPLGPQAGRHRPEPERRR